MYYITFIGKKKILQSWLNSYSQENTIVNISMFKYAQVFFLKIYFGFFNWLLLSMGERHMGQIVNKYPLNRNFTQKIHYLDLETWFKFHAHQWPPMSGALAMAEWWKNMLQTRVSHKDPVWPWPRNFVQGQYIPY